jgi:hypothetical protein
MIFEGAQWTDPTSLEVFGRVVNGIATPSRAPDRHITAARSVLYIKSSGYPTRPRSLATN